jgi:hypothetical protein
VRGDQNAYQLFPSGASTVVKGCQGKRNDRLKRLGRALVGSQAIAQSGPRVHPDPVPPRERRHAKQSGINMRLIITLLLAILPASAWAACALSDITIESIKARFVDECGRSSCTAMKGIAVLANRCAEPVGVQLKITGYDRAGRPVASRDLWPASVGNIPPGDYPFSLDQWLKYDPEIKAIGLTPIGIRQWQ